MKKIFLILALTITIAPAFISCREEKTVEVETLAPDAEDGDDDGFDTNPVSGDE